MKLFSRIFLSFFVATILMIAAVLGAGELFPIGFPGDQERRFQPDLALAGLTRTVNDYERHDYNQVEAGIHSLAATRHVSLHIFDETGSFSSVTELRRDFMNSWFGKPRETGTLS